MSGSGNRSGIKSRPFIGKGSKNINNDDDRPKLILIGGCSGTGKSTFGMSVALDQGILKCISTDTLRSVMRSFIDEDISPALHRSSYASVDGDGTDDPIKSWKETCTVLKHCVEELVDEMIERRVSLVVEGVHLIPDDTLIKRWEDHGGVAIGIMLTVPNEKAHKQLLFRRGAMTGKGEDNKLKEFHRIRTIHDEMSKLAKSANWLLIEQNLLPDPLEIVADELWKNHHDNTSMNKQHEETDAETETSSSTSTATSSNVLETYFTTEQLINQSTYRNNNNNGNNLWNGPSSTSDHIANLISNQEFSRYKKKKLLE